jgi:hypothetical protein
MVRSLKNKKTLRYDMDISEDSGIGRLERVFATVKSITMHGGGKAAVLYFGIMKNLPSLPRS